MAISATGCVERHLDVRARDRVQPAEHAVPLLLVGGQRRHPEAQQRLLDEFPMWPAGISSPRSTCVPSAGILAGITTSTPYGRPSVLASIQASAASSSSASLYRTQPSTPRPPALLIAAATCSDGVKPTIGCSMPNRSQSGVRSAIGSAAPLGGSGVRAGFRRVVHPASARVGEPPGPGVVGLAARRPADLDRSARPSAAPCTRRCAGARPPPASARSRSAPSRGCTIAATRWPRRSSGMPITSVSKTSGCSLIAPSTSSGKTFSPPVFTHTLPRPSNVTVPSSSTLAKSPGTTYRSPSTSTNIAAVLTGSL